MKTQGSHAIYRIAYISWTPLKSLNDANINVNALYMRTLRVWGTHVADATRQLASNSSSFDRANNSDCRIEKGIFI